MTLLIGDNWSGNMSGEWQVEEPDTADVHNAIQALNGKTKTTITVNRDDPYQQLTIAGGPKSFVVTGELADESIVELSNPDGTDDTVTLICGGQQGEFLGTQVVDIDTAIAAMDAFLAGFPAGLGSEWIIL